MAGGAGGERGKNEVEERSKKGKKKEVKSASTRGAEKKMENVDKRF